MHVERGALVEGDTSVLRATTLTSAKTALRQKRLEKEDIP